MELMNGLATSLGVFILPPTSAKLEGDSISISSAYALPLSPTSENIIENARKTRVEGIMTVPTFLANWATEADEEKLSVLRKMRFVGFGGGPLAYEKGQFLVDQRIKVRSLYGGTEVCCSIFFLITLILNDSRIV
jgi:acyl-coenzyme A synthetase/AMP-(fatty) acid ligase